MLPLVLALSVLIGVSLGLLGGGGTILTVPILVSVAHLPVKEAVATSLLVVGLASVAAVVQHRSKVVWRTGLLFGAAGMAGAFAGGRLAAFIPEGVILGLFAAMMLATAIAMLRSKDREVAAEQPAPGRRPILRILGEGLVVGAVTGVVGAGGGFLVVPALAVLGGLPMKSAIATSLLVIALKSFAGFAGYLGHVEVDLALALPIAAAAIGGSWIGGRLARRISPQALRKGFAWFVIVMAVWLVARELPDSIRAQGWFQAVFVDRWPWWIGGAALSLVVLGLLYFQNQMLGVSTGCAELCSAAGRKKPSWRIGLLGGLLLGGFAAGALAGVSPSFAVGGLDQTLAFAPWLKLPLLLGAGVLIGFGARRAGGCTSGHAIVGVAQGARSSLIATALFMAGGFAATQLLVVIGGLG
jgi:hypothetical protein